MSRVRFPAVLQFLVLSVVPGLLGAAEARPDLPALKREVSELSELVPEGWTILAQDSGDLNGDGRDDHVVILTPSDTLDSKANAQRILVVLFAEDGVLKVSAASQTSVLGKDMGGVMGDPFENLVIERGTILVSHFGGSRYRWEYKHRYRFQEGGWYLIGRTKNVYDALSPEESNKDENLVTGRVIETKVDEEGNKTHRDEVLTPGPLPTIGAGKYDEHGYIELP